MLYGIVIDYLQKAVALSVCRDDSDEFPSLSVPTNFVKLGPQRKNNFDGTAIWPSSLYIHLILNANASSSDLREKDIYS